MKEFTRKLKDGGERKEKKREGKDYITVMKRSLAAFGSRPRGETERCDGKGTTLELTSYIEKKKTESYIWEELISSTDAIMTIITLFSCFFFFELQAAIEKMNRTSHYSSSVYLNKVLLCILL